MAAATVRPEATATLWTDGAEVAPLSLSGGRITLDESYAPYATADVEVPLSEGRGHWESQPPVWVVDSPEHTVDHPAEVVYRNDTTAPTTTGWTATLVAANGSGATGAVVQVSGSTPKVLRVSSTGATTSVNPVASIRGVRAVTTEAGRTYTLDYSFKVDTSATKGRVTWGTSRGPEVTSNVLTAQPQLTFVASGASTTIVVDGYDNDASTGTRSTVYVELGDVTVTKSAWTETIPETGHWEPQPDVWVPEPSSLEQLDPRQSQRIVLKTWDAEADPTGADPRMFDLGLRSRTVDHKTGRVQIELASDEALLIDRKNLSTTVDKTSRDHEASLRAVCQWALDKIGATLEAGTDDADVTARWSADNAVLNPDSVNGGAAFVSAGNATVTMNSDAKGYLGSTNYVSVRSVNSTASQSFVTVPQTVSTRKGQMWTFSAYMHKWSGVPNVNGILRVYEMDASGAILRTIESTPKALLTDIYDRHSVTFTIENPNTAKLALYASFMATAANQTINADAFMLTEGPLLLDYFSGNVSTPGYVVNWTGQDAPVANNSVSERRPADGVERLPELFNWSPGQSLNDFLRPLLEASGLRLFCDEQRVWRLIDPSTYEVPGYVVVQTGHNATEGSDTISRNTDDWATGVVVAYRWTDADGSRREEYDVAGTDGKVLTVERESEFPGPGAAAYILNSLTGRGRSQEVTALTALGTTPGQDVTINLPGTLTQTGKVRRVTFGLSDGLMELGTRGLTDALPGSWATWDPAETWSEVDPALHWKDA